MANALDYFDTRPKRLKDLSVDDVELSAATSLAGELVERGLEIILAKKNSG